jgi:hypothetical protein
MRAVQIEGGGALLGSTKRNIPRGACGSNKHSTPLGDAYELPMDGDSTAD